MGYRRRNYGRGHNYTMDGGYDSTGRWRSAAWHMDGGANDEGWHHRYCGVCGTETEHARGGGCVACDNRAIRERARRDKNPRKMDRNWVLTSYEEKAGNLPDFLASLKRQNGRKALSAKQVAVGRKVLAKHIDENTLRIWWDNK